MTCIANATTKPDEHEGIEITEEMIDAGERAFYESDPRFETGVDRAILIYEAMVRASPTFRARKCQSQNNTSNYVNN
jgi:hypothetical protein